MNIKKYAYLRFFIFALISLPLIASVFLAVYIIFVPPAPLWENITFSPLIMDRKGNLMHIGLSQDDKYRIHAKLEHIPTHVQKAVLLYEDQYFYTHPGVNIFSLMRAVKNFVTGGRRLGASTIAMQVARLRYNIVSSTAKGKLQQMLLALQLIYHYGHTEVFEAYFSLAPYGSNIEGIEAASQIYFHQSAQNLTHSQALALCLIPQNPSKRALKNTSSLIGIEHDSQFLFNGALLFNADFDNARNTLHAKWNALYPDESITQKAPPLRVYSKEELPFVAPHMSMEFLQKAKKNPQKQYIAYTSIDSRQQAFLEQHIQQFISYSAPYNISNASAMLLHWPSMEVRALVGSANFFEKSIDGQVDGTKARRSPGSTLKPFIYALALEQGLIHPQSMLMDAPRSFAEYNPENFDKQFQGPLPAHEALRLSRNVPAIELASRIEPNLYQFLQRAHANFPHDADHYGLSLVLGGAELSMRDLVTLYAMLANGGVWQNLQFENNQELLSQQVLREASYKENLEKSKQNRYRATSEYSEYIAKNITTQEQVAFSLLSPEAALASLYMLENPLDNKEFMEKKIPFRYKTGTSNGFRDAWTLGVVGPYVLAIWVGNFDNTSNPMFVGSLVAAPLYRSIAQALAREENLDDIIGEQHKQTKLIQIDVCLDTGDTQTELCPETVQTWFIPGRSPIQNSNIYQKIWIDTESGLRLCEAQENAEEVVWEFWPSEIYQLFKEAGIYKPLPPPLKDPFSSACLNLQDINPQSALSIQSPRQGIIYHLQKEKENSLAFIGASSVDATMLFWFVNEEYMGSSKPHEVLFWKMKEGIHLIRVLDDTGQSKEVRLVIEP